MRFLIIKETNVQKSCNKKWNWTELKILTLTDIYVWLPKQNQKNYAAPMIPLFEAQISFWKFLSQFVEYFYKEKV